MQTQTRRTENEKEVLENVELVEFSSSCILFTFSINVCGQVKSGETDLSCLHVWL